MRLVFGLVLILGVGLASFAVYMARGYITDTQAALELERAQRASMVPLTDLYVVTRQLKYGEPLTEEDIRLVRWPQESMPEGAFQTLEAVFPEGEKRFRTVLRTMEMNEPVLAVKVTEPGQDAGVGSRLSKGMRAFAIRVDVASGVSGFLRPGDKVDVYWTGRASVGQERAVQDVTKLIEAGIRIIAIDQTADQDRSSPTIARTVTVEASPRQVAALAQAQSTGRLSLSLVGADDESVANAVEIDQNQLLGIQAIEAPEVIERRVCTIKTRRGAEIIETEIDCPDE